MKCALITPKKHCSPTPHERLTALAPEASLLEFLSRAIACVTQFADTELNHYGVVRT